jgi:tetratricopeptide (TPR) repeat protein
VDTRSDVYSLGVLLYELLTGTTPFDKARLGKAAYDEVRRIIREEDPPKPSTRISSLSGEVLTALSARRKVEPGRLGRLVRGELDWIVMRALEKDRERRYETANAVARDVERYLADEPVAACPPSAAYRFRKFARRRRGTVLAASAVLAGLLVLVAGLAVSNRMIAAERNQKAAALSQKERALADREQALALAKLEELRSRRNFMAASVAVREALTKPALGLDEWAGMPNGLREKYAAEAMKYYRGLVEQGDADPALRYESAQGYRAMALLHRRAGDNKKGEACYRQALAILEDLTAVGPDNVQYRHQLAYTQYRLAATLAEGERLPEARNLFKKSADHYIWLVKENPASGDYPRQLGNCLVALERISPVDVPYWHALNGIDGLIAQRSRALLLPDTRRDEAVKMYRDVVDGVGALAAQHPTVDAYHFLRAETTFRLAQLLLQRGETVETERAYRDAIDRYGPIAHPAGKEPRYRAERARARNWLALLLSQTGRIEEAEREHRAAIEAYAELDQSAPSHWLRRELAWSRLNLGELLRRHTPRAAEAEAELRAVVQSCAKLAEEMPSDATYPGWRRHAASSLADLYIGQGKLADAEAAEALLRGSPPEERQLKMPRPKPDDDGR